MKSRSVLVLGYFASVHVGHRSLIAFARGIADEIGGSVTVVTFDDGMYKALGRNFREIYLLEERKAILESLSVDKVEVLPVTTDFLHQRYTDFLSYILGKNPSAIVVGEDYRYGYRAEGNTEKLKEYFEKVDVPVYVRELLTVDGEKASSTLIGRLLSEGKIEKANDVLGSPFFISGTVQKGFENGKKIDFPTLNLTFDVEKYIPKHGVYASKTYVDGKSFHSMTNIGPHPTLNYSDINAETHAFGLNQDLYGKYVKVELLHYIRPVMTFSSLTELKEQLTKDKQTVLEVLK